MNILDNIDLGVIRTTKLKSGEEIVGVTYNLDEDAIFIDFPHEIQFIDDNEFILIPFMYFTTASGCCFEVNDIYFSENSSAYISKLYIKYLDDLENNQNKQSK